ncbi:unnamed protein product [marine sediment metagenome]|uniref:Glycosyltransferase 2-like domain-containing protein n=1 Tax=marine sediment metagenome TaxID=412755 RepID=X1SQM6_9ZZZZ
MEEFFDSIFNLTYKNVELIIIDNNSQDNSVEIIQKNYPIVKIVLKNDIKHLFQKELDIEVKIGHNINELKSELNQQDFVTDVIQNNKGLNIKIKERDYFSNLLLILGKYKISYLKEYESTLEDLFIKLNK